ncbi:Zinc finger protein 76 [Lasiodiplodia hormozganensis]|uniref:Zinc finger protein 76 n=1 Tax=Lasiodiplodia hormozganensis TaxID=869390 RepID=A0AA39YLY8_9PEZI|nr:Zinc finger protein 76 [Lasiodiplodia hormozganensis]
MHRLDAGETEGIDVFAQEHSLHSLQSPDLSAMECFGLGLLDEVPNGFDATGVDGISSFGQQTVAPLLTPHQRQGDGPMATNVSTPYRCMACSLHFKTSSDLEVHCAQTSHRGFACPIPDCEDAYRVKTYLRYHIQNNHQELRKCNQCQEEFGTIAALGYHASETGHASFFCPDEGCGKTFSRFDVFQRHQDTHRLDVPRHPCQYCRKYRGANGFKRKDHLTQHVRNYHHIGVDEFRRDNTRQRSCPREDCSEWRPKGTWGDRHAFQKSSDYIAHMRKVHKESEFPCTEPGCERNGPKGYFRMRDLQKHKFKEHGIPIE